PTGTVLAVGCSCGESFLSQFLTIQSWTTEGRTETITRNTPGTQPCSGLLLWNSSSNEVTASLSVSYDVSSLAFSPDEPILIAGTLQGTTFLTKSFEDSSTTPLRTQAGAVVALAF